SIFADAILDFIEHPGAPNLYWALTALPRPLISVRKGDDFERGMMVWQFPDLADLDRARTAEQWEAALGRIRAEIHRLVQYDRDAKAPSVGKASEPASKSPDLAKARKYLVELRKLPAE